MGVCCCKSEINDGGDIPNTNPSHPDPIKNFEYRYPFHRMDCKKMFSRINGL